MPALERKIDFSSEEWLPVTGPVDRLIDDLRAVRRRGTIRIFCGEANPDVYNERFLETAEYVNRKLDAVILIMAGPIIVVNDSDFNGVLAAHKKGFISQLHFRPARFSTAHFRVIETPDGYRFYTEAPHRPVPTEEREALNFAPISPREQQLWAEDAVALFESWVKTIADMPVPGRELLPLVTTKSGIGYLEAVAKEKKRFFDHLGPRQLLALPGARQHLRSWSSLHINN